MNWAKWVLLVWMLLMVVIQVSRVGKSHTYSGNSVAVGVVEVAFMATILVMFA